MRRRTIAAALLLGFLSVQSGEAISSPRLVADLATTPSPRTGSEPAQFVRLGDQVIFSGSADDHARRLFRSDGTAEGTQELAHACGPLDWGGFTLLFATSSRAFYSVRCSSSGEALWMTDGTPDGTRILIAPGAFFSAERQLLGNGWVADGDDFYFLQGGDYDLPLELWRTDGTPQGTVRIHVLSESDHVTSSLYRRGPEELLAIVEEPTDLLVLWRSDGSAAGTEKVREIRYTESGADLRAVAATSNGIAFTVTSFSPWQTDIWYSDGTSEGTVLGARFPEASAAYPVAHAGSIYFVAPAANQDWIWRGDGSASTTWPIAAVSPLETEVSSISFFGGEIYFIACTTSQDSCDLFRVATSGGTPERVASVCADAYCNLFDDQLWARRVGARLYFTRRSATSIDVFESAPDGSAATRVTTFCTATTCYPYGQHPVVLDGKLFFVAVSEDGSTRELWLSEGTAGDGRRLLGPLPVISWDPAAESLPPLAALPGQGGWLLGAGEILHGFELWRARPQEDAASLVEDLRLDRPGLGYVESLGSVGKDFIFSLPDAPWDERTLYRRTLREVEDVTQAIGSGDEVEAIVAVPMRRGRYGSRNAPPVLRPAGNAWFFLESDFEENPFAKQIWRYDPVSRDLRTLFAGDPKTTGVGARGSDLVASGAEFLFLGSTGPALHPAIYRLRPLSGAISKLADLPAIWAEEVGHSADRWFLIEDWRRIVAFDPGSRTRLVVEEFPENSIVDAVALPDGLLVVVQNGSGPEAQYELRQTDGTTSGTRAVTDWPGSVEGCGLYLSLPPREARGPALFTLQSFCARDGAELWISDGSFDRTRKLHDFAEGWLDLAPVDRSMRSGFLLLSRRPSESGTMSEVWKTDGTPQGTLAVGELPAPFDGSAWSLDLGAWGDSVFYFAWNDGVHGVEVWRTDGTAEGTGLAADIAPGPASSYPGRLRSVGDQVIFSAASEATGIELWQVGGDSPAPELVADLYPGIESASPEILTSSDAGLLFTGDDGLVGRELWEVTRPSVARCEPDATTLCLADGRFRVRAVRRDFAGAVGAAGGVPLTGDSGYFWFFAPGNPELLVKIVDACSLPGFENFWVYSTGLTNVEVELEAVDTLSGERKTVRTGLGEAYGPLFDSGSFAVCDRAGAAPAAANPEAPPGSGIVLPLLHGRFQAVATWIRSDGTTDSARAVPLADDSGYFWFFDASLVEVLVKMVDACGLEGFDNFWVFAGGLTDVEVHLTVIDTWTGAIVHHDTQQGEPFPTLLETGEMRVCE